MEELLIGNSAREAKSESARGIKVDEALRIVLGNIHPLSDEEINLSQGLDRVLAEDIYSDKNIPSQDKSAVDGYAVNAADTFGAAKYIPKQIEEARRVIAGANIPADFNSVVNLDDIEKTGKDKIGIFKEVKPGENVIRAGEDIKKGELVFSKGTVLSPAYIGVLAGLEKENIKVRKRPKIAVLSSNNVNTCLLQKQILECSGIPKALEVIKDKPEMLERVMKEGLDCDLILAYGGIFSNDYDLAKFILVKMASDIKFCRVAMEPGRPLVFGLINGIPLFGLSSNLLYSMVSFEVFIRPAILKILGKDNDTLKEVDAVLEKSIKKEIGVKYFLMAKTSWEDGAYFTSAIEPQGKAVLKSMAIADSLIVLSEEDEFIEKGRRVTVRFLN